mmetsp:Transcript_169876/g.545157  ORF Transcript_169876/g.545157 Transcript_169876/m.545157 type:complete len:107 (+) Transcript_169876:61-381(+)
MLTICSGWNLAAHDATFSHPQSAVGGNLAGIVCNLQHMIFDFREGVASVPGDTTDGWHALPLGCFRQIGQFCKCTSEVCNACCSQLASAAECDSVEMKCFITGKVY